MEIDLTKLTPDIRYLDDMREVLYDKNFANNSPDIELYYMYRRIKEENGLVYNITLILNKILGSEFNKTKGHSHLGNFKDIYTVLEGRAICLMQKGDAEKIEDVYAVEANKGESVIIQEGYGHITINPSATESLKTSDWTSKNCKGDYSLFGKMHGACYFCTTNGWVKNKNYKSVPELRFEKSLKSIPKNLDFLK